ncbi:MAG: hypothetical protein J5746_08940 [Victivallales bacterium]|nr:hypothetical protein [Victivallales bacterium]
MSEEITEYEREQMRKFATFKGVALVILLKWLWLLILVFIVLSLVFSIHVISHFANSSTRYSATTKLMFTPRSTPKVQAMNDKHLNGILDRGSLKRRLGFTMDDLPEKERTSLVADLTIKQERKPSNFFTLTAYSGSQKGAIEKVNSYAEVLIDEYKTFRTNDLKQWTENLELRKQNLMEQTAVLDAEEAVAKGKTGVVSPVETLTLINGVISDQRHNYSTLSVQLANEEVKKKRLETAIGQLDNTIIRCAPLIRKKTQEIAAIDAELVKLREIYTDINPKVQGKLNDRKALTEEYMSMLKANGLENIEIKDVERVEQSVMELSDVTQKMEVLTESLRTIENEIKANEEKSEVLTRAIPQLERINAKRAEIEKAMRDLNENIGDIEYLTMTASSDLHQIEMASGAKDKNPMNVKNLAIAIGGALICTLSLTFWVILLEFFFGKVRNTRELAAYDDILVLGSLPKPDILSDAKEKEVLDVVALNFCNAELPKGAVLVCRLPGARYLRKFSKELDWSLSMAGQRAFLMEIVPSLGFTPPDDAETLVNLVRKDTHGWFPTSSHYALAPTEIQMFKADLAMLREEFDNVFIMLPDGIRHGGNFFQQLLELSESALLLVGANSTPRSELKYVRKRAIDANKQMMGLISGSPIKEVRREMELENE